MKAHITRLRRRKGSRSVVIALAEREIGVNISYGSSRELMRYDNMGIILNVPPRKPGEADEEYTLRLGYDDMKRLLRTLKEWESSTVEDTNHG